jgi:hypothetical protein
MSKTEVLKQLRKHLSRMFDSRFEGAHAVAFARSQGFADGYMQALCDLALIEDRDLLDVVNGERREAALRADVGSSALPPGPMAVDYA